MELIKMWCSCENCGLCWTKVYEFEKGSDWGMVECPHCKEKTENFDSENHNEGTHFLHY